MFGGRRAGVLASVVVLILGAGCLSSPLAADREPPKAKVELTTVDDAGSPVSSATFEPVAGQPVPVRTTATVTTNQPVAGVVRAEGFLPEPVVLDPRDGRVTVRLWRRAGPDGRTRRAMQFGGDVMLGRRFQQPESRFDTRVVTDDDGARRLVAMVAPLTAAADFTSVNLETVVGTLGRRDAYPAKRFLLQSPPAVTAMLKQLGVDLVTLGNNHIRDWQEPGVRSTIFNLDAARIPWAGAGLDAAQAARGRMVDANGLAVGVVSATTVNGDFVNDSLPPGDVELPKDLIAKDRWQYEVREWGFGRAGTAGYVPTAARRPGAAWAEFRLREPRISSETASELWTSISAVYPELQDWVARRGHEGAAPFDREQVAGSIAALRAQGADVVVVQVHGGFQFSQVASDFAVRAAHSAIDAGADFVIDHHPHVLQGFEWYRGHLIAYSLGNFVFDQDFLSTFPTAMVRMVLAGDEVVETRAIPMVLDGYRPVAVSGGGAARVVRLLDSRSAVRGYSDRTAPKTIGTYFAASKAANAAVDFTASTAVVTDERQVRRRRIEFDARGRALLGACTLVQAGSESGPVPLSVGVDLLQWGSFDDVTADGDASGGMEWKLNDQASVVNQDRDQFLRLDPRKLISIARPIARSASPEHRYYRRTGTLTPEGDPVYEPIDGAPRYTLMFRARSHGAEAVRVRLATYFFDDTDPTSEPVGYQLGEARLRIALDRRPEWRAVADDVTAHLTTPIKGQRPNNVLPVFRLGGTAPVDIDDVQLLEWRELTAFPAGTWLPADALAGPPGSAVVLATSGCQPTG